MATINTAAYTLRTIRVSELQEMLAAVGQINADAAERDEFDGYDAVRIHYDVTNIVRAEADTMPNHQLDRDPAGMYWGETGKSVLIPVGVDASKAVAELHNTASILRGRGKPDGNF